MNDTVSWALIVGAALPWLTAVVQRPAWSTGRRQAVAIACAGIGGVGTCLAAGTLGDGATVVQSVAAVLVASQATYVTLLKRTARAIEERTTYTRPGRHRKVNTTTGGDGGAVTP